MYGKVPVTSDIKLYMHRTATELKEKKVRIRSMSKKIVEVYLYVVISSVQRFMV